VGKAVGEHTYADYQRTPEDERWELIEGLLCRAPSPISRHQLASDALEAAIRSRLRETRYGRLFHAPWDVYLSNTNVIQPDLFVLRADRLGLITERYVKGAPDLVVEVLSPSTASRDQGVKRDLYARFGVLEYWIADPDAKTLEIHSGGSGRYEFAQSFTGEDQVTSPLLGPIPVTSAAIFAPTPRRHE
jgi:Uma2 family endonuclease